MTLSDGSIKFEVASQIVDRGDLPFTQVFVLTIVDPTSPKQDVLARVATPVDLRHSDATAPVYVRVASTDMITLSGDSFARIANVADITKLPRDRTIAVRQGLTTYLTSTMVLLYDSEVTADAAAKQVVDRLSDLVVAWRAHSTGFATNPYQDYTLPQPATGVVATRTVTYAAAKAARVAAETARDAASAAADACERRDTANKAIYDFLLYDVSFLDRAKSLVQAQVNDQYVGTGYVVQPAILTPAGPFTVTIAASRTHDFALNASDPASYEALRLKKTTDLATYATAVRAGELECAALAAALLTAQQRVDATASAERVALASVLSVCPTFDPSTV